MTLRRQLLLAGLGFLLLSFVYFGEPLIKGHQFVRGDMGHFFLPQRMFFARSIRAGDFPFWNPQLFCGFPFVAEPQNAVFYPPTWLFVMFPGPGVIWAILILHLVIAGVGTAWLARESVGAGRWASFCGGVVYAFSGFYCMHMGHFNQVMTCAWSPWVLFAALRFHRSPTRGRFAAFSILYGIQILPGGAENIAYLSYILVGFVVLHWLRRMLIGRASTAGSISPSEGGQPAPPVDDRPTNWLRPGSGILGGMILGTCLSGIQLLPTLELIRYSIRWGGLEIEYARRHSLAPWKFLQEILLPNYYGYFGPAADRYSEIPSSELAGYLGLGAVVLVAFVIWKRWKDETIRGWFAFTGFSLVMAFGKFTPLYYPFYYLGLRYFRNPSRFIFLVTLGGAVLAAAGVQHLLEKESRLGKARWHWVAAGTLAIVGIALAVAGLWPSTFGAAEANSLAALRLGDAGISVLAVSLLYAAILFKNVEQKKAAILLSLFLPLFFFARESEFANLSKPAPALIQSAEKIAQVARRHVGSAFRVFTENSNEHRVNRAMLYRLADITGMPGGLFPLRRFWMLREQMTPDSHLAKTNGRRLMDILCAQVLLYDEPARDDELELRAREGKFHAYLNRHARPRLAFVASGTAKSDQETLAIIGSGEWEPGSQVLLDFKAPPEYLKNGTLSTATSSARIIEESNNRVLAEVQTELPGYLVLSDAYYPGWEVHVNGQPAAIYRANYLFRAVAISAGSHRVEFTYRPTIFKAGFALSAISCLIIFLILRPRKIPDRKEEE